MATNNIKPFATDSSANVLTDTALASRSELQTGFLLKSKADSALIGKLMQNATAGAYAVGEFSAKYGTTDITGSDATGFATAFETAVKNIISTSGSGYKGEVDSFTDLPEDAAIGDIYSIHMSSNGTDTFFIKVQNNQWCQLSPSVYYSNNGSFVSAMLVTGLENDPKSASSHIIATRNTLDNTADFSLAANANTSSGEYKTVSITGSIEADQTQIFMKADNITFSGATEFSKPVTVQAPTENSNPATKQYVDTAITNLNVSQYATVESVNLKANDADVVKLTGAQTIAGNKTFTSLTSINADLQLVQTEQDLSPQIDFLLTDGTVKGTAPTDGNKIGGIKLWDSETKALAEVRMYYNTDGSTQADLTANNPSGEGLAILGVKYPASGNPYGFAPTTPDSATANEVVTAGYLNDKLINYAPLANPAFTGTATLGGQDIATINDVSAKISMSGNRGNLAGYEDTTVSSSALTINQESPDSQQLTAAVAITVSNGSANTAWVKKISIKNASVTISLGSAWTWVGGSQPTVTAPSLLVLSWDNDCGMAILNTTG